MHDLAVSQQIATGQLPHMAVISARVRLGVLIRALYTTTWGREMNRDHA